MSQVAKIWETVLFGQSDANIDFSDIRKLLVSLDFDERIRGSHHIFSRKGVSDIINIQPKAGKGKAYQVKTGSKHNIEISIRSQR